MLNYRGINHVALATGDMDGTIRFWRDLLGMRLIAGLGDDRNRQYFFEVSKNVTVAFFEWEGVEPAPDKDPGRPVKGPFVFDHLCIEVTNEDELWKVKERLEGAGCWVTEVINNGFIHSIFTTDPNNIQLEFACRVEGVDLSKDPRIVDSHLSAVTLEGVDPQSGKWPSENKHTPESERKIYPGELKKLAE